MKITIKEVAKIANVSVATVSRVINDKPQGVSETKRREIQDIIEAYGYKPNTIAQSMKTNRTRCIGLLIPDILNPFFQNTARGIEDLAEQHDYHVFLCNTDNKPKKYVNYIEAMIRKNVDGLIIAGYPEEVREEVRSLLSPIKVVSIDRYIQEGTFCQVLTDNVLAAYEMTKYFLSMGHKRIGCITGCEGLSVTKERLRGYKQALEDYQISYDAELVREGRFDIESGLEQGTWLMQNTDVTGIFCFNDMMAYGVYKACEIEGKCIPEDISVAGFDGTYIGELIKPTLTTINQPSYEVGQEAARLLIEWIRDNLPNNKKIILANELVLRDSVEQVTN